MLVIMLQGEREREREGVIDQSICTYVSFGLQPVLVLFTTPPPPTHAFRRALAFNGILCDSRGFYGICATKPLHWGLCFWPL